MKVLHISYALDWGGGEQQMVNLVEGVHNLNVENLVICIKGSSLDNYFKSKKIKTVTIERKKGLNISYLKYLLSIINNNNPDIIHIHTGSFLKDFLFISKFSSFKYKTIFTMNGLIRKKSFLSKIKYNNSSILSYYCISKSVEENFKENVLYKNNFIKTTVIYDGIRIEKKDDFESHNLRQKLSLPVDAKIVGNIANHTDAKDLMTFLKTANYFLNEKKIENTFFVQIGRKTKKTDEFINYIKEHKLTKNVLLQGFIPDGKKYLNSFNCFLMTSYREGLSMSILESFLYKIPVVSTKAGGIPEAVIDEETGLLANIGDYQKLGNKVHKVLNNENLKNKLVNQAYQRLLDNFTIEILAKNTLKLYTEINLQ